MKENGKIGRLYSWPIIIILLFAFWPIGIFLIIKRVSLDKKAALSVGKLIGIAGIFSYSIAIIGFLASISDGFGSDDVTMIIFFAIAGFALRKLAKNIKVDAERVRQYLSIIINGNVRQIDNIASATGKSYDVVRNDIQKMIKKGYLKNAYIDESAREVILPSNKPVQEANMSYTNVANKKTVTRVISCSCCGANNTISGAYGECEYCGSPIK